MIRTASGFAAAANFTVDHPIIGWESRCTAANLAATYAETDYPVTNLINYGTHLRWQSTQTGDQYLTHTTGSPTNEYDFCGIAGHNFGTGGWTVSIETDLVGSPASWTSLVTGYAPTDDLPLLFRWTPAAADGLRIKLTGGTVAPRASIVYFGKLLIVQRKVEAPHTPINMARKIEVTPGISQSGNFLGSIITSEGRSADIAFQKLSDDWFRTYMEDSGFLEHASMRHPFFFGWLPNTFPADVGFGWCVNDPRPTIQNAKGLMSVSLDVDAIA